MTSQKYLFEPTEGKLEYLQLEFNNAPHCHQPINFKGKLDLEDGYWVNYFNCDICKKRFTTYGRFTEEELDETTT
jgi:hypothetical protein